MAPGTKRNGKIDEQIEETFPASDPPSFMGGEVLGAPKGRKTPKRPAVQPVKRRKAVKKAKAAGKKRPVKKPVAKKKTRATRKTKSR